MRRLVVLLFVYSFLYPCSFKRSRSYYRTQICEFECNSGQCVTFIQRCDGVIDCIDGSDENECNYDDSFSSKCTKHQYKCKNNVCIPAVRFCDGTKDCLDGSDEYEGCVDRLNCSNKFRCSDRHCVFQEWVCDGSKDCPDGSDEWNCNANKTSSASKCKIENSQYFCENRRCISLNAVCNGKDDCGDRSDEAGCTLSNCSSSIKCDHKCKQIPKGSVCLCKPGYKLQNDSRTCIDIDECQTYGICDQECVNSPGSYSCRCQKNYFLQENKKTCKADAGEATLVFSTRSEIVMMYLDSLISFTLAKHLNRVVGVAMNGDHTYWSDTEEGIEVIVKNSVLNEHEVIVTTGLSEISAIAVDWITENIYFTDKGNHYIAVCKNDGIYCTILINDTEKPAGIALLPTQGKMYWCDWGSHIAVAGMDGKNIRTFVSENLWPTSLTIDYPTDRLYWVDSKLKIIESIRLDGTDRRLVLHDIIREPFSLAVFENKLYWSNWESKTIESCNKFTGKDWHILFRAINQPYSIHIDHSAIKPKINNPCHSNLCSELCMLNQNKGYTCACTLDKELNNDNHTCREVKKNQHLLIFESTIFINYYHGMLGKPKMTNISKSLSHIKQIVSDPISGQVIMLCDKWPKTDIIRFDPVSGISENILSINTLFYYFGGMAFDHIGNNLYITNIRNKTIEVYNIKTLAMTVFYFKDIPYSITLVPEESKMFVAFKKISFTSHLFEKFSIYEMEMNGLGKKKLFIDKLLDGPKISMYYDRDSKTFFVSDQMSGNIWSYSAKDSLLLRTGLKQPVSLTAAGDNIFWIEINSKVLYWTNFKSSSNLNHKGIALHLPGKSLNPLVITLRKDVKQGHYNCQKNNGNCSHVCLPSFVFSFICACPPGMALSSNNHTCIVHECPKNEFKCSEHNICISKEKLCDGVVHCPNGEDETIECHEKKKCKEDQFMCNNGECINLKDRCNSHYDCTDQSDEENCEIPKCKNDEFQCRDGTCILNTKVCNGNPDCYDFSDEINNNCESRTCASNEFMCNDHKCISKLFVCDDSDDCEDGEDEASDNCKLNMYDTSCLHDFQCNNGNCISPSLECDGIDDCHDGSDERHCLQKSNLVNCTADEYQCLNTDLCLSKKVKCDGKSDCPRNDDEYNCTFCLEDEFACDNKKCIPENWICDKNDDCGDNSDEKNCIGNRKTFKESTECDEFKCSINTCLPYSKVCDGNRDCPDGSDENGKCKTACIVDNYCKGLCYKTPSGAVCGCQDGYRLAADVISCEDINECESDVCSQICRNTIGSFECSCYEGYIIRKDKVSCRAIGPAMEFITVTNNDIRMISSNLHSIELLHSLSGLIVNGLDVNAVRSSVYWSNDEFGVINKLNVRTKEIITVMIVDHPQTLAVDWITDNVYVNDNSHLNTIKVCNLEKQRCATLIEIEDKAYVGSIIVDSINRWLFWAQITWHDEMKKPSSKIYRTDMIGADIEIIGSAIGIVSGMAIDHIKSKLYWSDNFNKIIESSNLDGSQRSTFLRINTYHPFGISIYEQSLYWLMDTNGNLQICKLYSTKSCEILNIGRNNVYKQYTILHISRQPIVKNPCDDEHCDYMCVLKKENAMCICSDGKSIKSNSTCTINMNSERKFKNLARNTRYSSSIYSTIIIVLLVGVLLLCVYYYYQKNKLKSKQIDDRSYSSIHFHNPSYDRSDEIEKLNSIVTGLSPGQHEYVNPTDDLLNLKATMENNESRQRSDSEERDIEETEKDSTEMIYFIH